LGMRGDGDMPMTEQSNIALLEKVVADQRKILADHATPTLDSDPKVWALYKEVQEYYEKGMRVPDDVTLLWCDDNWGNIRRLPTPEERKRPGGAGIYYHFDYVGDPRNYKWIDTNPISKVWEQMHLAHEYGADRIWIVNVGDLKPMEFPIEFFLSYARDPARWDKDNLQEFTRLWAAREFGPEHAPEIAALVTRYGRLIGRRKPELLDADTYSLLNYREADRVETEWRSLAEKAEALAAHLPAEEQDAYFELVLHRVKAAAIVTELYIAAGRSRLYARQGRASANDQAELARSLFRADAALSGEYNHTLAKGKWNHMMDQTHLGYTNWQEPPLNVMPNLPEVQPAPSPRMGAVAESSPSTLPIQHLAFDNFNRQTRYIDIFNQGTVPFDYSASVSAPWILLSSTSGSILKDKRIDVNLDWKKVPSGCSEGTVTFAQKNGPTISVHVSASHPQSPAPEAIAGFVEADGYVSMEAEHYNRALSAGQVHWDRIPDYGLTLSGMTVFPATANSVVPGQPAATLEYGMYLFDSGPMRVEATLGPTLNFVPGRGLRFAVSFDDQPPQIVDALAQHSAADWAKAVSEEARRVDVPLTVSRPGYHTLKFAMVDPGIVLERLVVSKKELAPSYLGPPESYRHAGASAISDSPTALESSSPCF